MKKNKEKYNEKSPEPAEKQKKVEEMLHYREERCQNILENIEDGYYEVDLAGNLIFFNDSLCRLHGCAREEMAGMNYRQYTDAEYSKTLFQAFHKVYNTGKSTKEFDWQVIRKDGSKRYIEASVSLLKDSSGKPTGFRGITRDITDRKKAEELLKQSESKYRLLADYMKDYVWLMDASLNLTYISPSIEKTLGYALDDFRKSPLEKFLTPSSYKTAMNFLSVELPRALVAPPTYLLDRKLELEYVSKDGQRMWGEASFSLIRDEQGKPVSILGESRNITARKKIEDELRASECNFRHSLDDSPLGVRISTMEGETIYANKAMLDIYGYDRIEELKEKSIKDRYTPESYVEWRTRKEKRAKGEFGPAEYDIRIVRKDGEVRQLHVFRKEIFWNGQKQSQIIYNDVTEQKIAEEKLHQSEEKYRTILEDIHEGYFEIDLAGNFTFFNDHVCRVMGYTRQELMGMNNRRYTYKKDIKKVFQAYHHVYKTGVPLREFVWRIINKDGTERYIEGSISLLKDSSGRPAGFRGLSHDITERKQTEEKLQETLSNLKKAVNTTIQVLVSALESRDPYTAGHQSRCADLACSIAMEMGLDQNKIEGIRLAGSIHDIGKLSIPSEILTKPAKLTSLEFSLVQEHPLSGFETLKDIESPWPLAEIVYQHHERVNGTGYPNNLKGDDILIESRILAVADVVEAIASHRPYRPSLGIKAALEEIEKNKGVLYDVAVADACLKLFRNKVYQLS